MTVGKAPTIQAVRTHEGQARASARKKRIQAARLAERQGAARDAGMTLMQLDYLRLLESRDAVAAAAKRVASR